MGGLDALDPVLSRAAQALIDYATAQGYNPRVTSTVRSWWDQQAAYSRYVSGRAQFPAAPPGRSAHQYGWAFDLVVEPDPAAYEDLGAVWEGWGGTWGGRFQDRVHFEFQGASRYLRSLTEDQIASLWS